MTQAIDYRDRKQWTQDAAAARERNRVSKPGLTLKQAALDAEKLTPVAEFNRFLQILQAQLEDELKAQQGAETILKDPAVIGDLPLLSAKIDYLRHQDRIDILRQIIDIPSTLFPD